MDTSSRTLATLLSTGLVALGIAACDSKHSDNVSSPRPATSIPETSTPTFGDASNMGRTVGAAIDDSAITAKVKTSLVADPDLKGAAISVTTEKGQVALSGTVANQAQVDKAIQITKNVEGVKKVDNTLVAKSSS